MPIITEPAFVDELPEEGKPKGGSQPSPEWQAVADDLRVNPDQWRLVATDVPRAVVTNIKTGRLAAFRLLPGDPGCFDAVSRNRRETGRVDVYARYVTA